MSHENLTTVRAWNLTTRAVHLAFDRGTFDSSPLCGALAGKSVETIDEPANCSRCATQARTLGLGYLLKDESGWTDIYQPHKH